MRPSVDEAAANLFDKARAHTLLDQTPRPGILCVEEIITVQFIWRGDDPFRNADAMPGIDRPAVWEFNAWACRVMQPARLVKGHERWAADEQCDRLATPIAGNILGELGERSRLIGSVIGVEKQHVGHVTRLIVRRDGMPEAVGQRAPDTTAKPERERLPDRLSRRTPDALAHRNSHIPQPPANRVPHVTHELK